MRRKILLQGRFQRFHIRTAAPHIADLLQGRQLGQRIQAQVIKELLGRAQQGRAADDVAITDGINPAPVLQHLDRLRIDGNTAYLLDIAARHRLPVGDDGQRFQRRARVAARLSGFSRSRYTFISGRIWKRQPVARLTTSTPLPTQSPRNSSNSCLMVSAPTPSLRGRPWSSTSTNSFFRLCIDKGSCAHSKAVSRTCLASAVSIAILWLHLHAREINLFSEAYGRHDGCRLAGVLAEAGFSDAQADCAEREWYRWREMPPTACREHSDR